MSNVTIAQVRRSDHVAPEGVHLYVVTVHFGHPNSAITVQVLATSSAQAIAEAKTISRRLWEDIARSVHIRLNPLNRVLKIVR